MDQVELTKTDVEKKVERILKLIKRRSKKKEPEIIALVEDFHRQYQSLYAQYEHFKRKSGEKTPKGEGNESYPYYASSQESEYYSPTDVETETDMPSDNNRGSRRWMADNIKEELKRAYGEDADMKHQLASKTEERASDHLATSSKNFGKDEVTGLKTEVESMHHEKGDLELPIDGKTTETKHQEQINKAMYAHINCLRAEQCGGQGSIPYESNESFGFESILKPKHGSLHSQKEVILGLESEVDALRKQKIKSEDELRSNIHEINQLREEKSHLNSRIIELEALYRERGLELSAQDKRSKRVIETAQTSAEVEHLQMDKNKEELQTDDQQRMMKEIEENTNRSMDSDPKLRKQLSIGNKLNNQVLERKMEDLAQELYQKIDDNIRLLCLRIAVVEKTHYENKQSYKNIKERLDQENESLKQKNNADLETKLSEEEQKLKMLKDVSVLENRVGELEKINKEKDEELLSRDEEKREAIRQLCVLIEYHRNRCDHLKESISKLIVRIKKNT